jgi:type II secretory pathway pseudopilin PulG
VKGTRIFVLVAIALAAAPGAAGDLTKAKAEQNLERRSKLALENAAAELQAAREAYRNGDSEKVAAHVAEVGDSVDLAYDSLKKTNKDPRRSPKWFKNAEISTRDLLRKLDTFQQDMSFNERAGLDELKAKIQQVHDDLLVGLMEGKKHR